MVEQKYSFLHNYQTRASDYWLKHNKAYFAVDCGLGKTAAVLYSLTKIKKPTLVIAPLRPVHATWPAEIEKWGFPLSYTVLHGPDKHLNLRKKKDVYITNFESIAWLYEQLYAIVKRKQKVPFEVVVIDEGSKLKNSKTKRFQYLDALRPLFPKYRVILSGSPAPNSLLDLWAQYYFLSDGKALGDNYSDFCESYYIQNAYNPYKLDSKKGSEEKIYKKVQPYTFRLDAKDYLELPPISYTYTELDLTPKLRVQYRIFKKQFIVEINEMKYSALNAATLSGKLRQFLQGFNYYETGKFKKDKPIIAASTFHKIKLNALVALIDDLNQPILCTIQFKHELEMIRKVFPKVPVIAGETSSAKANMYIKQWNNKEIPLLLCHPLSLSHGVNLQSGGCNIVWYCQTWSSEQYLQFNKRLHRQGQKHGVVVHHLTIKDSIDDKVAKVLSDKTLTQQKLLDFLRNESNY